MSSESAVPSSPSSTITSNNGGEGEGLPDVEALGSEIVPSSALVALGNALRQDRAPHLYAQEASDCFQAALQALIAAGNDRLEPHCEWFVSEFLVEIVPEVLNRVLKDTIPRRWPTFFPDVLGWCSCLTKMGCILLSQLRGCPAPDEKVLQVVRALLTVFDCRSEFAKAYRSASRGRSGEQVDDNPEEPDGEGVAWRLMLAEKFQEDGGIESMCRILDMTLLYPEFDFIEGLIVLGQRIAYAGQKVLDLRELSQVVAQVLDGLKNGAPQSWRCTLIQMTNVVPSILGIITVAESSLVAEDVVGRYQQHVVSDHLKTGTFNTRVAAVNWLDTIIYRACRMDNDSAIQRIREWLHDGSIVELMLSEHLEKTHYAEQVLSALRMMAQANLLENAHVKSLYQIIEPEGTFEGLKENVHTIVLHLLDFLNPEQVRAALEIASMVVGDVASATRMSNLVYRVVNTDREVHHSEQTMGILWSMMVQYSHVRVESDPLWRSFIRCKEIYADCDCSDLQEKYLKLAVRELMEGKVTVMMLQVVTFLYDHNKDTDIGILDVVVLALQRYHDQTPKDIHKNAELAASSPSSENSVLQYDVNVTAECLKQVKKIATCEKVKYSGVGLRLEVAEQIWDLLVLDPVCLTERIHALEWFIDLVLPVSDEPCVLMTDRDAKALLHGRICDLDPFKLDFTAFRCFRTFFVKVSPLQGSPTSPEVDYLWKVLLNNLNADVAAGAQEMVGNLYAQTFESQHEFIRRTMSHLRDGVCELAGSESNGGSCADAIDRLSSGSHHGQDMKEECAMRIMRCLQALDFMMKQAHSLSSRGELLQSEDLIYVLLYLADCRHPVHDVACSLLDNLPLRQGLVTAMKEVLPSRDVSSLNSAIDTAFHRGVPSGNLLPEKARYVILALVDVLYSGGDVENECGGLVQLCLSFLLDLLEKVDTKQSMQADQVAKCGRRLHMEGMRLVSRLCSDLISDPHPFQQMADGIQPLQANHTSDANPSFIRDCLVRSSQALNITQESRVHPGSPMVDDDVQNCPPSGNLEGTEALDSKPEALIGGKMDSMDLEPKRESAAAMGSSMDGVQEEFSCQKGSAMDISTGRTSGQCSSVDATMLSDQQVWNREEGVGKDNQQNGHHLPTISEIPPGNGIEEEAHQQEDRPRGCEEQGNPHFHRDSENTSSVENPISACSSSEVGAAMGSPRSDQANPDPPTGVATHPEVHTGENHHHADPDLSASKPVEAVARDDQDGSHNDPGIASSCQSSALRSLLNRVLRYYVHVICEAGGGWGCMKAGHRTDIELVRETVEQLGCLAGQWDFILDVMMSSEGVVDMLVTYLLSPVDCIRKQMVSLVRRINKCGQAVGPWLFQLLKKHRSVADKHPESCQEFYTLLQEFCKGFENCTRLVEVEDAGALLQEVLEDIRAQPYEESPKGTRLGCQLRLLAVLIKVLEPDCVGNMSVRCEGPAREGDLVQFLMKDILFPETCLLRSMNAEAPSIGDLMGVLKTKSTPLSTREAAFDLLLTLMKISSVSHKMAMDLVWKLHFNPMVPGYVESQWQPAKNPDGYVGLQNAGATCYMNAVLQQLFMHPTIRSGILSADATATEQDRGIFYPFQRLFGHLQCSDRSAFFPGDFIERYTHSDGQEVDIRQHHDALEFFQRTQELVDDYMSRKGLKSVIKNEIGGLFSQQIICRDNRRVFFSETQQPYTEVTLEMFGKTNLQESLEAYVSGERLEGDNAYFCQEWGKKVPALKRTCIKTLPHTLVIHLKRFELDYETMETFKIQERFEFPLTLDMFPYTSAFLLQKEGLSKEDGVNCDPTTTIQPSQCQYQLMGVVVHKGEIDGGHYYSFIKERSCDEKDDQDCRWWRFDDSSVEEWDVSRLDEDCFGGPKSEEDLTDRQRDSTEDSVKSRANNAYLLIYEQILKEDPSYKDELQLGPNGIKAYPQNFKDQLPLPIFKEVLVENVRLLSTTRVTDLSFMHFMQKLLQTMPSASAHRKMRRLTPPESKSESESSSGSEGGGQGSDVSLERDASQEVPQESKEVAGRRDDAQSLGHDIADLVFEYILRIMFTPCVFSEADYASWEHILKVIQDGSIALHVAVEKLANYSERVARCLIPHACEPSSDFVFHFVMAVIKEARRIRLDPENMKGSAIYRLGHGILEACDSRSLIPLDLLRVFEVVRCCAEMALKCGHRSMVLKQLTAMQRTSAKLSSLVWAGRNSTLPKKLESLNGLLLRTVQSVVNETDEEGCRIPKIVKECFYDDCDPEFVKGFVHPVLLVQADFVDFLQRYMWDSDSLSIWVLDGLLDLLVEENERMGWLDPFDKIATSILMLLSTGDCFHGHSQRALYFIQPKRERDREGLYQTIFMTSSHTFRWKLVYLLMRISKQEANEDVNRLFRNPNNDRLVNWVVKDGALSQLEAFINRKEVYEWTRQITGAL